MFHQPLNYLCRHWYPWAFIVSAGVLWGLPQLPFYQGDLPVLFKLGGSALVAIYCSLGFLSVSLWALILKRYGMSRDSKNFYPRKHLNVWAALWAFGGIAIYFFLMDWSTKLS